MGASRAISSKTLVTLNVHFLGANIMSIQENILLETRAAAQEFFRYALAVPTDKVEWSPLDAGRTVLDLCREVAMCPTWAADMLTTRTLPEWDENSEAAAKDEQSAWLTVEACQEQCEARLENLYAAIRALSDEQLKETMFLPFEGGRDFTMIEVMSYPRWNINYHTGQVGYIQTLYGDKEMY